MVTTPASSPRVSSKQPFPSRNQTGLTSAESIQSIRRRDDQKRRMSPFSSLTNGKRGGRALRANAFRNAPFGLCQVESFGNSFLPHYSWALLLKSPICSWPLSKLIGAFSLKAH